MGQHNHVQAGIVVAKQGVPFETFTTHESSQKRQTHKLPIRLVDLTYRLSSYICFKGPMGRAKFGDQGFISLNALHSYSLSLCLAHTPYHTFLYTQSQGSSTRIKVG